MGNRKHPSLRWHLVLALLFLGAGTWDSLFAYPVTFTDSSGASVVLSNKPQRVVSLVPAITEIIFRIGAGEAVVGLTHHDSRLPGASQRTIVGGSLTPSLARMDPLELDLIFLSSLHQEVRDHFAGGQCRLIDMEMNSLADLYRNVQTLGVIFNRETEAVMLIETLQGELRLVAKKVERLPQEKRKRVMRFNGRDRVMTPGDDSFQNEFIRAAGGIPPQLGKKANAVDVTLEEWTAFNPQVLYGCGEDREAAAKFFSEPGWRDVEAVQKGRIIFFPCELTSRVSVRAGEFVAWLAAEIYDEELTSGEPPPLDHRLLPRKPLDLALLYVRSAAIVESNIFGFPNKTLVVEFKEPMGVTSTLEGERQGILTVGNHYSPPPCWNINHRLGLEGSRDYICKGIGKDRKTSCFLFTGANMKNLSVQKAQFKDMVVYALVTAGVESNAMRMAADEGRFYEPGTINVLILTNMRLSARARARAIITATEAKTAALQDLDVRSAADPREHQATGTGTDEVLVVEGQGTLINNTGGHCKMGELIARAVHDGVKEAAFRQNGIAPGRNVFQRLRERHLDLHELLASCNASADRNSRRVHLARLEEILLQPRFASFIEASLALSDAYERGQVKSLEPIEAWCRNVAEEIAGRWTKKWTDHITSTEIPIVMRMSLNALLNGLYPSEE